jgi:hypothetical protein
MSTVGIIGFEHSQKNVQWVWWSPTTEIRTVGCNRALTIVCHPPDRLCGLVIRVPDYRSRGPGSIPGATRFSEK